MLCKITCDDAADRLLLSRGSERRFETAVGAGGGGGGGVGYGTGPDSQATYLWYTAGVGYGCSSALEN